MQTVIDEIVRDYAKLDPKDAGYFKQQKTRFETRGLAQYKQLLATIKRRYHGVPVGASESIFAPLAQALGLKLLTPASFLKAISEGTEPTAKDKSTIDRQIATRQIKVWVFNSQNSTPDVQRITDAARKKGISVTTITETLSPASASFQAWQDTWRCYAEDRGGDALQFVMEQERLTAREALAFVRAHFPVPGLELRSPGGRA